MCVCVAGYMCCNSVLDKDGVSAAAIAGEMVSFLATKNKSLSQQLTTIYEEWDAQIDTSHLSNFQFHSPVGCHRRLTLPLHLSSSGMGITWARIPTLSATTRPWSAVCLSACATLAARRTRIPPNAVNSPSPLFETWLPATIATDLTTRLWGDKQILHALRAQHPSDICSCPTVCCLPPDKWFLFCWTMNCGGRNWKHGEKTKFVFSQTVYLGCLSLPSLLVFRHFFLLSLRFFPPPVPVRWSPLPSPMGV